jgi:hypothetical protein
LYVCCQGLISAGLDFYFRTSSTIEKQGGFGFEL